ncbi:MAG: hypothetical protein ACLR0U_01795 [Enterocloster clostridioformis]
MGEELTPQESIYSKSAYLEKSLKKHRRFFRTVICNVKQKKVKRKLTRRNNQNH